MRKTILVEGVRVECESGTTCEIKRLFRAADEGGTIQAHQMVDFSPNPIHHTATSLATALARIGARIAD